MKRLDKVRASLQRGYCEHGTYGFRGRQEVCPTCANKYYSLLAQEENYKMGGYNCAAVESNN